MAPSPRRSLRAHLALQAAAIGAVTTVLVLGLVLPLWRFLADGAVVARYALPAIGALALLVFCVSYFFLVRWIARPAEALLVATERVGSGLDAPLLSDAGPALGRLVTAFGRMEGRLHEERERVRAQLAELQAMNRELTAARDTAIRQEKLASVGRLASGVAHEIGNPVAAILGYVELLKAEGAAPPDYLERIDRELQRIDRIVRDLLDYARPRGADPQPVALRDVVERVLRLARPQARFRSLELELEDGAEGIVARADEHALGQVILNLLQNAADAMGGAGTIRVAIGRDASRATLRVIDRGPGIPAADLPKIFDPFFTTKAPGKGTGLGLPLCQGWLEAMGGSLHASNRPEGGAELRIELPAIERA